MRELVTEATFYDELNYLEKHARIAVDTETTGLDPFHDDVLVGISTCAEGRSVYFPFRHREGGNLPAEYLEKLLRALERKGVILYGYNFKFDLAFMKKEGFNVPQYTEDTQIAAHILNENELSFKLKILGTKYVDPNAAAEEAELLDMLKHHYAGGTKAVISQPPAYIVAKYAAQDAWLTEALYNFYKPLLETWELYQLYKEVCEYQMAIFRAEQRGILIDKDKIRRFMGETGDEVERLEKQLIEASHGKIENPGSPKQICFWFGIESSKRDILTTIRGFGELPKLVLKYRALRKVNNTFYQPYLDRADSNDVIHATFHTTGTRTGRLSCSNPNLQQVAKEKGIYRVKEVFVARPGYDLVQEDLSQAEYRLLAHYTKEKGMIDSFLNNVDFHEATGRDIGYDRDVGKTVNFAVIYGLGAKSFSMKLNIPQEEAQGYLDAYHDKYPGVRKFTKAAEQYARMTAMRNNGNGYVKMWTGRLRHFNLAVANRVTGKLEPPYHKAANSIVQGGVAEITRVAMTRIDREVPQIGLELQVHDALVFETPQEMTRELAVEAKKRMEDFNFMPPMRADIEIGKNWGHKTELNPEGMEKWAAE